MRIGKAVIDLDLVTDLRRRVSIIRRRLNRRLGARHVANRDAAVSGGLRPILQVQIEFAEIVASRVEPRLRIHPCFELLRRRKRPAGNKHFTVVADALPQQRSVGHHGPLPVADDFPSIQVLAVEEGLFVGCRQ